MVRRLVLPSVLITAVLVLPILLGVLGSGSVAGAISPPSTNTPSAPSERVVVLDPGPPGSPDSVRARSPFVLREGDGSYRMWYSGLDGYRNRILYATSADGISWTKQGVVFDVLTPPYYFDSVGGQVVLKVGLDYHMWFSAGYWSGGAFGYWAQIYHAVSPDGLTWTITGVALSPDQTWDVGMVNTPWVIQDSDGLFWLYFFGWDGTNERIGVATSTDGLTFVPYSENPVLDLGRTGHWDSYLVQTPSVVRSGASWTMWYSGNDHQMDQIGKAYSTDLLHWKKDNKNPVLSPDPSASWDSVGVIAPDYLEGSPTPRLYFVGNDGTYQRIGMMNVTSLREHGGPKGGAAVVEFVWFAPLSMVGALGVTGVALAVPGSPSMHRVSLTSARRTRGERGAERGEPR